MVCGLDGVGLRTVEQLYLAGVPVVAVEFAPAPRAVEQLVDWAVPLVTGHPDLAGILAQAGLAGARAVVCTQGGDLQSLATALLARDLRPDIRLVVRLANSAVGDAVAQLTGPGSVLDAAGLAAPAMVEDCLRQQAHRLDIAGESFIAVQTKAPRAGSLRELYGDLAPVAVLAPGAEPVVCPGRDEVVAAGDRVTVLGTSEQLAAAGVEVPATGSRSQARRRPLRRFLRLGLTFLRETDRPLRVTVELLVALVAIAGLVLRLTYRTPGGGHLSGGQAVYFAVETVATVGYGDFSFAAQGAGVRAFGVALIVLGVLLVSTTFALVTNILVSRRLEASLGRQRATGLRGHVVLVGLGSVGVRVLEGLLAAGREVVVLERDDDNRYLRQARALGVLVLTADATLPQTLAAVNVQAAAAVAVLTSDDLTNIETGLAVRQALGVRWGRVPVVLRVFDRQLARTVEQSFGFSLVRSVSVLAAPWFVGAALGLDVLGTFSVARLPFLVGRLRIAVGGGLDGLAMQELSERTRVVAISRAGGGVEVPRRGTRFAGGDSAYLIGPYTELLAVLRRDQRLAPAPEPAP